MKHPGLLKLAAALESPAHLAICDDSADPIEVIAVRDQGGWLEAFPLPFEIMSAAASAEMILDTTSAVRIEPSQLPSDFWEGAREVSAGDHLTLTVLARAGQKYLYFFRAVREELEVFDDLKVLNLSQAELSQVTLWIRECAFFNHQKGDVIMRLLLSLTAPGV